jgi:N-formylglutamate amidohydrolase
MDEGPNRPDSQTQRGGRIPGTPGHPAFLLTRPEPSPIPVLISVPHAGRAYPDTLLGTMRSPEVSALRLEDRYVDRIGRAVARETGAALLVAHAPRAMIDLNRAPDDIDWEMFGRGERPADATGLPSRRARSGLGLIPRRVPGIGELWNRRHREEELRARVEQVHEPYHDALSQTLAALRDRWGAALLLDLHSMPPVPARPGLQSPEFVIGDRFGATCNGAVVASAFACLGEQGRAAAHTRPYAGGYTLERHARPSRGVHTIQLEIDRSIYLDSQLREPGEGLDASVEALVALVRRLGDAIGDLGGNPGEIGWSEAAE